VSTTIAVAGKGGSGKTTLASLIIRFLHRQGGPILVVDADPNSNLGMSLGLSARKTIGQVQEEFMGEKLNIPPGLSKQAWLEVKLHELVEESEGIDLIVMGRPDGPGCYCSVNAMLRDYLEKLSINYKWTVVDNEAGMEHLSRRTTQKIDILLMVTEPSPKGLRTAAQLNALVEELKLPIGCQFLIVNRSSNDLPQSLKAEVEKVGVDLLGTIPRDEAIVQYDLEEKSLLSLPDTSVAVIAVKEMMNNILKPNMS
jgi:CO dehydrogenase maturation factor